MIKSKNLLILALSLLVVILTQNANADLSCQITNTEDCAEEHIVLKLKNVYGEGYNNAHAELKNYSSSGYPYAVCCNSTTQEMNNTCNAPESTVALRLHNETNTHVQAPNIDFGAGNYSHEACIAGIGDSSCTASYDDCDSLPEVDYVCLASIASSEYNDGHYNHTNAHIASCGYYDLNICCSLESPPQEPVLISPISTDVVTDRTPLFNWSYTGEEPNIVFELQLSHDVDFLTEIINETNIEQTHLDSKDPLEDDLDLEEIYYWRVRAVNEDNGLKSDWVEETFIIDPYVAINITNSRINFSELSPGDEASTTGDDPLPFGFKNVGNVEVDLYEVTASQSLWNNTGLGEENWQIKAREDATAFNTASSKTSFVNVETTTTSILRELNFYGYHEANNEASIDIKIIVPAQEPPGEKTSTLTFSWKQTPPWCDPEWGIVIEDVDPNVCWQKTVSGTQRTHSDTLTYCSNLKLEDMEDWDAPTRQEMVKLRNYACEEKTKGADCDMPCDPYGEETCHWVSGVNLHHYLNDEGGFTGFVNSWYWTKTYSNPAESAAWSVSLYNGRVNYRDLSRNARVVCVSRN